jgi:hypothetical protein
MEIEARDAELRCWKGALKAVCLRLCNALERSGWFDLVMRNA